jgi:fructose-bisphosphate aldolase class II
VTLVRTAEIVNEAREARTAVAAFNVITLEHAEAVVAASETLNTAVIVQLSENAIAFHRGQLTPIARAVMALAQHSTTPVSIHLDHATSLELCVRAGAAGFSSVMFDASRDDYALNVARTLEAAEWAHSAGFWIEAELGEVAGKLGAHANGARTDPGEAAEFVRSTHVDALAVAVGSSHAMETRSSELDQDLISRLRSAVDVPLVLHGSSGVPQASLRLAVANGIVKVNIGTALNIAYTSAVATGVSARTNSDPRPYLSAARAAIELTVSEIIASLG